MSTQLRLAFGTTTHGLAGAWCAHALFSPPQSTCDDWWCAIWHAGASAADALAHLLAEWRLVQFWPLWERQQGLARLLSSLQDAASRTEQAPDQLAVPLLHLLLTLLRTARSQALGRSGPPQWAT